jgi:serine/threonine-protein kinase
MQNYIGKQIDRYRIIERLGMGGMAVVYKAYDTRLERDVALKLIRTQSIPQDQHERLFKRFEREAKAQARFKHPHIVAVHDYGEVDNSPYLVMDFISGGTLKERLQGPVGWQQAARWLIPVAEALSYAHQRGIVHRDVKPANIIFDEEDQPILTDFGIAKILETDEATLTGTGLGVGTPEYMAPEQWQGQTSEATDQYALGVVLYELITGHKPYSADTPAAIILMQANEPLQAPSGLVQGIPDIVEKVLYKALARDPRDRYENMDTFSKALRGLLSEAETAKPALPEQTAQPMEPSPEATVGVYSEGVTRDALDTTPAEEVNQPPASKNREKRILPKWAGWALGGIVGLGLIYLALSIEKKPAEIDKNSEGPLITQPTEISKVINIPTSEPTLGVGSTSINQKDDAELVFIPTGGFLMGKTNGDFDETPEHPVYLDAYWIGKYEVTNAQYRQCIEAENCTGVLDDYPQNQYPAVNINWDEASNYCAWAGGRLPTEAEWEKAARGEDGRVYPWGADTPSNKFANFYLNTGATLSVGSFEKGASPYGVLDMAGNVWEWVADWYDSHYYEISPIKNPRGPKIGELRVVRGGSWTSDISGLETTNRAWNRPDTENLNGGFRCVFDDKR